MLYLVDTNIVSDMIALYPPVAAQVAVHLADGDTLGLCRPTHYEVLRGLYWRNATGKLNTYYQRVIPLLTWTELIEADWEQASHFWADARRNGKQIGDPDLLLAALAFREHAVLVSADADFDALPIQRENWRI